MKIKIIVLIVFMLLTTSAISAVGQTTIEKKQKMEQTSLDDNVPIWDIGDSWTYTVNDFTFDYEEGGQRIFFDGSIDDFTWTVADTSGSTYRVDFTGDINCDYEIYLSSPSMTLYVTGTIKDTLTRMTGSIIFTKDNLKVTDLNAEIIGITAGKISPLPFALPLPFKVTINADLSQNFPLFDFPLSSGKFWNMPNIVTTVSVSAGGIFGLIKIPISFATEYPWFPLAFHCLNTQDVTVEAGTFNAYKIESTFFDMFEYYYAPSVGNMVKIDATMLNGHASAELKSTNYV